MEWWPKNGSYRAKCRARQALTRAVLAPRTFETLEELRRKRCQSQVQPIPLNVMEFTPVTLVELDARVFATSLRSAPRGSAAGPGGCTYEMRPVCLDDVELLQMLTSAAEDFARAAVPRVVFKAFQQANMTALKRDGGVRGIATGTSFRRLVAKSLARQFSKEAERACVPFQFALSTRARTDCVEHVIRASTDASPTVTVLSVDGIGAYDHVFRGAMLSKLLSEPALHGLLPFVRAMYSEPSHNTWRDKSGNQHDIVQCEGGERGDPLVPLFISLGIDDALSEAKSTMGEEKYLLAFLDDEDAHRVRHFGRRALHEGRDPSACGQNTGVEPRRRLPTRSGGAWARSVEPTGSENPGHTVGIRRIRARDVRGTIAKRARIVGRHSQRSRPVKRVAGSAPVCPTSLSPPPPDSASRPIPRICHEARRGNERGHGIANAWSPR